MNLKPQELPLLVLIISTPSSTRVDKLINQLSTSTNIETRLICAKLTTNIEDCINEQIIFDQDLATNLIGRPMLPTEIGCAHSHNIARRFISQSSRGGVILEDDARIHDVEMFVNVATNFLDQQFNEARALSLAGWEPKPLDSKIKSDFKKPVRISKLFGEPPLAVGYVVTPLAGKLLYESNSTIIYTADWPSSKVDFFVTIEPLVYHGDITTSSVIDFSGVRNDRQAKGISKLITPIQILFRTPRSISLKIYFKWIIVKKTKHKIDSFRLRVLQS